MMAIQSRNVEVVQLCVSLGLYVADDTDFMGRTYEEQANYYCAGQIGAAMCAIFDAAQGPMLDQETKAAITETMQGSSFGAAAETVASIRKM